MDRLLRIEKGRKEARGRMEALAEALSHASILPRHPPESGPEETLDHVRKLVSDHLIFRLGEGFGTPVITVFAGGTGVGKSTILNTVAGHRVSEISVKRPCTTAPLVYHHEDHEETLSGPSFLPGYAKEKGGEGADGKGVVLSSHDDESLRDVILIDSPDFDSVSDRNRDLSEDLLRIADLVIYIVNPEKYADDEVWQVIRKIASGGRRVFFVFNRAHGESDEAVVHFRELLREAGIGVAVEVLYDWRKVSADGFITDPGSARRIREVLAGLLAGGEEGRIRGEVLRATWEEVRSVLGKEVIPSLRSDADLVRRLRERMEKEWSEAERRILEEVNLEQLADRKRASEILRANLFDLVRFAEKKILGPVTMWVERWSGTLRRRLGRAEAGMRSSLEACHQGNRAAIHRHIREGKDRVLALLESDERGKAILQSADWEAALLGAEEIDGAYEERRKAYEDWMREEFEALTRHVKSTRSVQLALLQVLYLAVLFGAMAKTGGAITLAEGLLAGPIIMLLDRLFVKAIDWEVVERLQRRGQDRFREIFPEITGEQIRRGVDLCESLWRGSVGAGDIGRLLDEADHHIGSLVDALIVEEGR